MRLTGRSEDERLDEVWAYLSLAELQDLFEALAILLEGVDTAEWHHHIGGSRGELTLAVEPG